MKSTIKTVLVTSVIAILTMLIVQYLRDQSIDLEQIFKVTIIFIIGATLGAIVRGKSKFMKKNK